MPKAKPKPFAALDWAFEQDVSQLQTLLLVSLARHADMATGVCWPSQKRLAKHAHCKRPTANLELRKLEDAGLIKARRTIRENGSEGSKEYLVLFREGLEWPDSMVSDSLTPPVRESDTPCQGIRHPPVSESDTPCQGIRHPIEEAIGRGQANKPTNSPTESSREETKIGVREDRPEMKLSRKDEEEYDKLLDVLTETEDKTETENESPIHRRMVRMHREQLAKNAAAGS